MLTLSHYSTCGVSLERGFGASPGLALVRRALLASQSLDRAVLLPGHPGLRPHLLLLLGSNIFLFYFLENAVYILPALFGGPALLLDFLITLNQVCSFFKRQLKVTPSVRTCRLFQKECVLVFPQLSHPLVVVVYLSAAPVTAA